MAIDEQGLATSVCLRSGWGVTQLLSGPSCTCVLSEALGTVGFLGRGASSLGKLVPT